MNILLHIRSFVTKRCMLRIHFFFYFFRFMHNMSLISSIAIIFLTWRFLALMYDKILYIMKMIKNKNDKFEKSVFLKLRISQGFFLFSNIRLRRTVQSRYIASTYVASWASFISHELSRTLVELSHYCSAHGDPRILPEYQIFKCTNFQISRSFNLEI